MVLTDGIGRRTGASELSLSEEEVGGAGVETNPVPRTIGWRGVSVDRNKLQRGVAHTLLAFAALLGGFLVYVFGLSSLTAARAQAGLERRFEKPLVDGKAPSGGRIAYGTPVARLDIPSIGVHDIVVEGTTATLLATGPGHLAVSPLPGQVGNSVLLGHRAALAKTFSAISSLRLGARIHVLTGQGNFTYLVTGHETLPASDLTPFKATRASRLTLATASDLSASKREVVTASLVGAPRPYPPGRPAVLQSGGGGLTGESGHLGVLAVAAVILLLVAAATVYLYGKLPRWSSYIATTPVVVLASWIVYMHLALLLPGTL